MAEEKIEIGKGDALIVVDVQNDFLPGGALAVPQGDEVVPVLNRYIGRFRERDLPVFATRDWHPENHCSFKERGGPWPPHCMQETKGADFAPDLKLPSSATVISKGDEPEKEAYSGFQNTDLDARLRALEVKRVFVGGLATDYCVLNTVKDGVTNGFRTYLLEDAIRAVNVEPDDGKKAREEMVSKGARPIRLENLKG